MLTGKTCHVTLLCENALMNSIIDRFGEDAPTQIVDKNHFTVEATVDLSSNFYGWVFASGGKMKITAPQEAVDGFQRMLESFSERQPADETPSISIGQVKNEDFPRRCASDCTPSFCPLAFFCVMCIIELSGTFVLDRR